MSEVIARRYAEALFQLGKEKKTSDVYLEECHVIRDVFQNDERLNTFLTHPGVTAAKKEQFLKDILGGVSQDVLNTIKLLVARHRTAMIPDVMTAYIHLDNDDKGILQGYVYSARALSDSNIQKLEETFARRFGKNEMQLENIVDPTVIGGIKLRVGNTVYDGSIKTKLHRIERNIVSANN